MPLYGQDSANFDLILDHLFLDRLPAVCPTELPALGEKDQYFDAIKILIQPIKLKLRDQYFDTKQDDGHI